MRRYLDTMQLAIFVKAGGHGLECAERGVLEVSVP
jgi:hypothetical protein